MNFFRKVSLLLASVVLLASSSFGAIQYAGGTNVNAVLTASAGTKQELSDFVEDQLVVGGWSVVSGSHTTSVLLQSATTPASLTMRLSLTQGTNCVIFKARNVSNTLAQTVGEFLLPAIGRNFRIISNKYQYFISLDGAAQNRGVAAGGVLYVPSFTGITEAIWSTGNAFADNDSTIYSSFKNAPTLAFCCGNGNAANYWITVNGTQYEFNAATNAQYGGVLHFVVPLDAGISGMYAYRWFDNSVFISEPLFAASLTSANSGEVKVFGQLWDAAYITESMASETSLVFDSHNWLNFTNANTGSSGACQRGGIALVVP
jgi:hypothetical protein